MKKKLLALFLALVMVGAVLPGCGDGSRTPADKEITARRANRSRVARSPLASPRTWTTVLTPHQTVAAGTREVLFNIFEGLVKPNSDGEMIPAVAEKYELSEDGDHVHLHPPVTV